MKTLLLVFLGGGLGSVCRYALGAVLPVADGHWPWATFIANAMGCLLIGLFSTWLVQTQRSSELYALLATGFCGGFTTFSTFSREAWILYQHQQGAMAITYMITSLLMGIVALVSGIWIYRLLS